MLFPLDKMSFLILLVISFFGSVLVNATCTGALVRCGDGCYDPAAGEACCSQSMTKCKHKPGHMGGEVDANNLQMPVLLLNLEQLLLPPPRPAPESIPL